MQGSFGVVLASGIMMFVDAFGIPGGVQLSATVQVEFADPSHVRVWLKVNNTATISIASNPKCFFICVYNFI